MPQELEATGRCSGVVIRANGIARIHTCSSRASCSCWEMILRIRCREVAWSCALRHANAGTSHSLYGRLLARALATPVVNRRPLVCPFILRGTIDHMERQFSAALASVLFFLLVMWKSLSMLVCNKLFSRRIKSCEGEAKLYSIPFQIPLTKELLRQSQVRISYAPHHKLSLLHLEVQSKAGVSVSDPSLPQADVEFFVDVIGLWTISSNHRRHHINPFHQSSTDTRKCRSRPRQQNKSYP